MKPTISTLVLSFFLAAIAIAQPNPHFYMTSDKVNVSAGESFTVNVKVTDFTKIQSMQYLTLYSSGDYKLDSISSSISVSKFDYNDTNGKLSLAWISNTLVTGTTVSDSSILYKIHFHALQATAVNNICFSEDVINFPFEISYYLSNSSTWNDVIKGSFSGLGCGFAWAKTANGFNVTGTNDAPYSPLNVTAYPNPTDHLLHFKLPKNQANEVQIDVFDLQGKSVQHFEKTELSNTKELTVPTETLPAGIYLYRLTTKEGVATGKFTKI